MELDATLCSDSLLKDFFNEYLRVQVREFVYARTTCAWRCYVSSMRDIDMVRAQKHYADTHSRLFNVAC